MAVTAPIYVIDKRPFDKRTVDPVEAAQLRAAITEAFGDGFVVHQDHVDVFCKRRARRVDGGDIADFVDSLRRGRVKRAEQAEREQKKILKAFDRMKAVLQ